MDLYEEMKWVSLSVQCDQPGFHDLSISFWAEKPCNPKARGEVLRTSLPWDHFAFTSNVFFFNILLTRPRASNLNKYKWPWLLPVINKHIRSLPFLSNAFMLRARHLFLLGNTEVYDRRLSLATSAFSGRKTKKKEKLWNRKGVRKCVLQ